MDIVVTHPNADFDALASQVAVAKLYPEAIKVSVGTVSKDVHDFLALHKEHFELTPVNEVDLSKVRRLILVDVRRASRLKKIAPLIERIENEDSSLEVHIYDHHVAAPDDLRGKLEQVVPVGSTTTLLVDRLRARRLHITPIEATLFALGIYSDTGSLTYPSTTSRDAEAVTFLLERGASLTTLRLFLHAPLGTRQRQIMSALLNRSTLVEINGVKIGFATVPLQRTVKGLSQIVNEVLTLEGREALFAFFPVGSSVAVIGRSQVPYLDVGMIMQKLGGGGHPGAGSLRLKNTNLRQAKVRLMAELEAYSPAPRLVRHMMSTPVHTVSPEKILDEVYVAFKMSNISGAPVMRDGAIVGIISNRDIRAAKRDGRSSLSASSCMTQEVKTIGPDTTIVRALELMVSSDIGRLPVLENQNLVGIITRSDILKVLYTAREAQYD